MSSQPDFPYRAEVSRADSNQIRRNSLFPLAMPLTTRTRENSTSRTATSTPLGEVESRPSRVNAYLKPKPQ